MKRIQKLIKEYESKLSMYDVLVASKELEKAKALETDGRYSDWHMNMQKDLKALIAVKQCLMQSKVDIESLLDFEVAK